jgi:hypothetical protein
VAARKSGYDYLRERQRGGNAKARKSVKRLVHIDRPVWLHGRNETGEKCPCCHSENAYRYETFEHLQVLFDRETGFRVLRTSANAYDFDQLAKHAERIECPARVYDKQLPILFDREHKIIGVFGGTQGGKSAVEAEWLWDHVLDRGGEGAVFWWVGPDAKQARKIGLGKLVKGQRVAGRLAPPLIPRELVVSYPKSAQQDIPLTLIDGTEIWFKHASETDASNLKGEAVQDIVLDEGCAVRHETNWDELLSRLTTTGGQILTASTPVLGNFLEARVYKVGKTYEEIAAGADTNTAIANLTVFDNPWQSPANVAEYVRSFGTDTLRLRLQAYGEWVTVGERLWRNFDKLVHVVEGPARDCSAYGLVNITAQVAAAFFEDTVADLSFVGGQDFNLRPMNLAVLQVGCPYGMDTSDPQNWVLFIGDLVAKEADIVQWAEYLRDHAGGRHGRALEPDYYRGMAIAADASKGHANKGPQHGEDPYMREMVRAGFDCRPCHRSPKGRPINPTIPQRTTLLHRLMADRIALPGGGTMPRFIVHGTFAAEVVKSLEQQTQNPDGTPYKVSNTRSDRISGPIDATGYGAWSLLGSLDMPQPEMIFSTFAATA